VKSVLIVDDSQQIRSLLRAALLESGWTVCGEAVNGRDAVLQAQQLFPDLIILDLSMPEMNGLEAAERLKFLMPTVPLLMFTTHSHEGLEQQASRVGIYKVFSKDDGTATMIKCANGLWLDAA